MDSTRATTDTPRYRAHVHALAALHRELARAQPTGNLIWSPFSVASALGLIVAGAGGETRAELVRVLAGRDAGDDAMAWLAETLAQAAQPANLADPAATDGPDAPDRPGDRLAVTNTLWARQDLTIRETYEATVRGWPGGAVQTADFGDDPEAARELINADVAKTTHDMIRGLLGADDVTVETVAVLVSVLWQKLRWAEPFDSAHTRPRPFATPDGARSVPMMSALDRRHYAAHDGWRSVSLATAGGIACDLLLPDDPAAIAVGPGGDTLVELWNGGRDAQVDLWMPRFDLEHRIELTERLEALGVRRVFTDDADLSGISGVPLRIDRVVHRTAIRADEKGAEAAAATAAAMVLTAFEPPKPVVFHADRPFLLILRHVGTGAVYFVARILDPSQR